MPSTPVQYVGILSRIKEQVNAGIKNKILILLSGPEPQRSILENLLIQQLRQNNIPAIFIRGLPASTLLPDSIPNLIFLNHLGSVALQQVINESELIISRSGYSTIMDLLPIGKKCIFIPTPGQAEQEYLAEYLSEKGWACAASQNDFSLPLLIKKSALLKLPDLSYLSAPWLLDAAIAEALNNAQIK
jgi:UDP-N-acetylglucosamine transferase subunit ALG13